MATQIEKGIITRMYMENFVTYDNAIFKPGKNLNLIIGPNGTGKSTVVCAIVLGLGGKPKVIGRAEKVSDYVKAGCENAKIEIELRDSDQKSIVITRRFNLHNQSTWMINGRSAIIKEVLAVTKQLNIQVDNLCQFLPQDKVQSFSEMDSKALLMETERSVGDPLLLEYHEKLIEFRSLHRTLEADVASKSRSLENKEQKYEGLKDIVGNIKEKKTIKKKINSLNQKKQWMLYDQLRQHFKDAKKKRDDAAAEMKELDDQLKPINAMIDRLKSRVKVVQKSVSDQSTQLAVRVTKAQKAVDAIQSHEDQIKEIEDTRDRRIEAEQSRDQQINHQQQQKSKLDNDLRCILEEFGSEEALSEQQNQTLKLVDQQRKIIDTLTKKRDNIKYKEDQIDRNIRNLERELHSAREVETQRLELLRNKNPDAYRGVLWLRENRQRFSAPVHEPMFLLINVKNPKYSKYLENSISYNDLVAFVCENIKDMNLLVKHLRSEQKLVVNIVHSDPNRQVRMNPNIPLEHIKQFGFEHYLVSLVEAPSTIMKYIVQNFHLNNIPVGTEAVEDNMDHIPDNLTYFFSKSNVYSINRSRYTGDKSVRQNAVSGNGMLSITVDSARLNGIHDRINLLKSEKQGIAQQIQEMEAQIKEADKQMSEYRNTRSLCQQNIQKIQALRSRIRLAVDKIKKLQDETTDIEEITAMFKAEIQDTIQSQLSAYKKFNSLLEDCFAFEQESGQTKLELQLQKQTLRQKENDSQELRDRCDDAERTFKVLEEELRPLKNEVDKLYKEALASTHGLSPQDRGFRPFNTAFEKLPPTIQEIEEELRTAQAKVFCMAKNDDSENILQEFEKVQKEVEELRGVLATKTNELETITTETENLRNLWMPLIEELVDRINENFSRYFSEMKCAGEVSLTHDENIMDFDKYGMKIRVKFRDADKLQELTRHHQSGGERAVTTAVYMISLQELSRVPFRCVDEINQGMDAVNERRIFELIVNITGRNDSSQYFLLTPKLLPNLEYSNTATVHCVHNGQFMISHKDYDVAQYCNLIQRSG